jgi:hypothetical protein
MKSHSKYGKHLHAILSVCALLILFNNLFAQTALQMPGLSFPLIPGERSVKFNLPLGSMNAANLEAWVFYAATASELENLNNSSFQSGSGKHFGRAVMVKSGTEVECSFVFPHGFHPRTPNADLFATMNNVSGLVTTGYPSPQIISGIAIPGTSSGTVIDFNPVVFEKGNCVYYRIYKRTRSGNSFTDEISSIRNFRMPDSFNIGIAGDSYGAGEGAPADEFELNGNNSDLWISCKCHRSKKSGLLKGVKKMIASYPDIAIDYSFQACSGAETQEFFNVQQTTSTHSEGTALYTNDCGGVKNVIQFQAIRNDLITNRKHDAVHMLLMSGGGNNTGFGEIVIQYLIAPLNLAALNAGGQLLHIDVLGEFKELLNQLPADYADLDGGINLFFPERRPIIGITTYPDPTEGLNGRCGRTSPVTPAYLCASYENDYLLSPQEEYEMIHDNFLVPLNNKVKGTTSLGWQPIVVSSGEHGMCNCDDPYFNTMGASYNNQGDIYGIVHPNREGYKKIYQDKIFSFVQSKYNEYRTAYYLGIVLGLATVPEVCTSLQLNIGSTLNRLKQLSPVVSSLKGFEALPAEFTTSSFQLAVEKESVSSISNIQNSLVYKSAFNNLPLKSTVVKTALPARTISPLKAPNTLAIKMRNDLRNFISSPAFTTQLSAIKKQVSAGKNPAPTPDPLDELFNQ